MPLAPAIVGKLAGAQPTDARPSLWNIDTDRGLMVTLDADAITGERASAGSPSITSPDLVPGSKIRWSRWWRAGHLAVEEIAAWITGESGTPVGVIESRSYTPIQHSFDVQIWAPAVGITDLAYGWVPSAAGATRASMLDPGDVARSVTSIITVSHSALVRLDPVSPAIGLVGLAAYLRSALPQALKVVLAEGGAGITIGPWLVVAAVLAYGIQRFGLAVALAFHRAALAISALGADITVPPVLAASIAKTGTEAPPRPLVIRIPDGGEPPDDCRDSNRKEEYRMWSNSQGHHIFPEDPPDRMFPMFDHLLDLRAEAERVLDQHFGSKWLHDESLNIFPIFQKGKHGWRYHLWIYERIIEAGRLASNDGDLFLRHWAGIREYIDEDPEILDLNYWCP